jgi:hypothetical protein
MAFQNWEHIKRSEEWAGAWPNTVGAANKTKLRRADRPEMGTLGMSGTLQHVALKGKAPVVAAIVPSPTPLWKGLAAGIAPPSRSSGLSCAFQAAFTGKGAKTAKKSSETANGHE